MICYNGVDMSFKKSKKLVPNNVTGDPLEMQDYDFRKAEPVASRRTHMLGLKAAVGDITLKQALCAAYFQGQYDMIKAL